MIICLSLKFFLTCDYLIAGSAKFAVDKGNRLVGLYFMGYYKVELVVWLRLIIYEEATWKNTAVAVLHVFSVLLLPPHYNTLYHTRQWNMRWLILLSNTNTAKCETRNHISTEVLQAAREKLKCTFIYYICQSTNWKKQQTMR